MSQPNPSCYLGRASLIKTQTLIGRNTLDTKQLFNLWTHLCLEHRDFGITTEVNKIPNTELKMTGYVT